MFSYVLISTPPIDVRYFSKILFFKTYTVLLAKDETVVITNGLSSLATIENDMYANESTFL